MLSHNFTLLVCPAAIGHVLGVNADHKEAFIGHYPLTLRQLHLKQPLSEYGPHVVCSYTNFLIELSNGSLLKGFSRLHSTTGRGPIFLALQCSLLVGEAEKKHAIFRAYDE